MAQKSLASDVSSEEEPVQPPPKHGRPPFSLGREVLFTRTLLTCQILAQAGMGQGLAVLDMIGDQFHVTSNGELSWYSTWPHLVSLLAHLFRWQADWAICKAPSPY